MQLLGTISHILDFIYLLSVYLKESSKDEDLRKSGNLRLGETGEE